MWFSAIAKLRQRQTTQAVVGAKGHDYDLWGVFSQCRGDARTASGGCFSRDAGIDDVIIELLLLQASA